MPQLPTPLLLAITDRHQSAHPLPDLAESLFAGGLRWLSLREKDLPAAEQVALARALVERAGPWRARVTVHGDAALAFAAGAAGVHLADGGDAAPVGATVAAARALLGPAALIGVSAHDAAGLRRAGEAGADYATLSPVFPSPSKPGYGPALGLERLRALAAESPIPVVALGGIDRENASACRKAGAAGVAVMGIPMRDPSALKGLLRALEPCRD